MAPRRRLKIKAAPPPPLPNDPTPERQRRTEFKVIPAPRFADEHVGRDRLESTRKKVDPLVRMESGPDPWLDRRQAAGLERYSLLVERSGYETGIRSCLDVGPGGGGGLPPPDCIDARAESRLRQAAASAAIRRVDMSASAFVDAIFSPTNETTIGELAKRLLRGGLVEARVLVRVAGEACALHFERL